jgi:anti-sigma-K factor RskA
MSADVHGLSGAYAVDALDEREREAFESHLAQCAECQAEVASLREAAVQLSHLTAATPPPALRDRVLAQARTIRPLPPLPGQAGTGGPMDAERPDAGPFDGGAGAGQPTAAAPPDASGTIAPVVPLPRRRVLGWFAAAAAAVVLAVGALAWSPWDQGPPRLSAAQQVLHAKDAQRVAKTVDGARATIVRSPSLGKAVLVTDGMPPAPAGHDYQLWLALPGRGMVSAGLMPHSDKPTETVLLQGDAAQATGAGITVEPAGGSVRPTTTPIALFSFG